MVNYAELIKGGLEGILKPVSNIIDKTTTNESERAEAKENVINAISSFMMSTEGELTERLKADMNSDSKLSKNIRPLTLIVIISLFTVLSVSDGNLQILEHSFKIKESYILLLGEWGKNIMYFYFGGRSLEKIAGGGLLNFRKNKRL